MDTKYNFRWKKQSSPFQRSMPLRNYGEAIANALVSDDRSYPPSTNTPETNRKNEFLEVANGLKNSAVTSLPKID